MTEKMLFALLFGSLGLGLIGGLAQKIIFDWLKRNNDSPTKFFETTHHCEGHEDFKTRLQTCETCLITMKKDYTELSTSFKAHVKEVEKSLDQGHETFNAVRKDVARMSTAITTIATIIEERTNKEGPLFMTKLKLNSDD